MATGAQAAGHVVFRGRASRLLRFIAIFAASLAAPGHAARARAPRSSILAQGAVSMFAMPRGPRQVSGTPQADPRAVFGADTVPSTLENLDWLLSPEAQRSGHPGPQGDGPEAPRYRVLMEKPLPGHLDVSLLADELASKSWTEDSLIVKALMADGAREVVASPWSGRGRNFVFATKLDIPWETLQELSPNLEAPEALREKGAPADITGQCQVYQASDSTLIVEVSFDIPPPLPKLHVLFALQPQKPRGFTFAAAPEFQETGGVLDKKLVKSFIEKGYMEGAKSFARKILKELWRRSREAPAVQAKDVSGRHWMQTVGVSTASERLFRDPLADPRALPVAPGRGRALPEPELPEMPELERRERRPRGAASGDSGNVRRREPELPEPELPEMPELERMAWERRARATASAGVRRRPFAGLFKKAKMKNKGAPGLKGKPGKRSPGQGKQAPGRVKRSVDKITGWFRL